MRFHARNPQRQLWLRNSGDCEMLRARYLRRAEYYPSGAAGTLDLAFEREGRIVLVPQIEIAAESFERPGDSPMLWPRAAAGAGHEALREIERAVLPWLASHALAGRISEPLSREFFPAATRPLATRPFVSDPDLPVSGGSSGCLLFLLRDGYDVADDADSDEARAVAARLRREGFTVELASGSTLPSHTQRFDLVHVFASALQSDIDAPLAEFRRQGVPVIGAAVRASAPSGLEPAAAVRAIFSQCRDEASLGEQLDLLDAALGRSDAVTTEVEHPCYQAAPLRNDCGLLPPSREFVFAHAPVEWRTNLPILARAAADAGLPLIVAGQVVDADAAKEILESGDVRIIQPAQWRSVDALYATARVFADVSWQPAGLYRVTRAAAFGCRLLRARSASVRALAAELRRTWEAPPQAQPARPGQALSQIVGEYASAPAGNPGT